MMRVCGVGFRGVWLVGLLVCVGVLAGGGVAWGGVGFVSSGSFGQPSPGLLVPVGLAVDNSADASHGDVYAADQGSDVLYKFAAGGALLGEKSVPGSSLDGVAVDRYAGAGEGDVLVAGLGSGVAYRFTSGLVLKEELKGLVEPTAVAFDEAGGMFVAEIGGSAGGGKVLEFNAAGVPVDAEGVPSANNTVLEGFGEPRGLAVSADGTQLYLATPGGVSQYSLSGSSYGQSVIFSGESSTGVSVDAAGEVFVDNGSQITAYESAGGVLATFGAGVLVSPALGVSIDETSGDVYVADAGSATVDSFEHGETPEEPSAVSASGETGTSARLEGTLNGGGSGVSGYFFQYAQGTSCTGGGATEPEPSTGGPVHAEISGLIPNTQYTACLVATNSFGSSTGPVASFNTLSVPPVLEENPVTKTAVTFSQVGSRSAIVSAQVNTENQPAKYHFLYGPATAFPAGAVSTPEVSLPANTGGATASAQLTELKPQTEYKFQIIVENSKSQITESSAEAFHTLQEENIALPDKRVYEMVTPPNNQQANVYIPLAMEAPFSQGVRARFPYQVEPEGNAIAYVGDATTGGQGETGSGFGNEYLARRASQGGWTTSVLQPASHVKTYFQGFSSDLSVGVLNSGSAGEPQSRPLTADAPGGGYSVLYARDDFGGEPPKEEALYQPLFSNPLAFNRTAATFGVSLSVETQDRNGERPVFAGGSAGFGDLFFEANDDILPAGDPLRAELDSRIKDEITNHENNNYLYESVGGRSSLVDVLPGGEVAPNATFGAPALAQPKDNPPDFAGVVSGDGGRAYWTDEATGVLFDRVGLTTVQVSPGAARYWTSVDDGRYAFYTEGEQLLRYDAESKTREPLTGISAGVLGVIGASANGESVYVVASTVFAGANATKEGALPVAGQPNLYLLTQSKEPLFIAALSEEDGNRVQPMASLTGQGFYAEYYFGDWQAGLGHRTAGVTAGGVVFMSNQRLPVVGFPHGYLNGGADEVYSFQADTNQLFCVSCSSSGEPVATGSESAAAFLPVSWGAVHLPEWTADGGDRVFFDSEVPLVAQDTNGRQDVYEWEREGTGGCEAGLSVNGGCIYLLSGGTSESDSWFIGASESGNDVFIASRAQFVSQDRNDAFNLFDARVGGVEPVAPPACTGTGCQGLPAPPPSFATPASVTFTGVGNFPPPAPVKPKSKAKKVLTRAEKLAAALKVCSKRFGPHTRGRSLCEVAARRRYPKSGSSRSKRPAPAAKKGRK